MQITFLKKKFILYVKYKKTYKLNKKVKSEKILRVK